MWTYKVQSEWNAVWWLVRRMSIMCMWLWCGGLTSATVQTTISFALNCKHEDTEKPQLETCNCPTYSSKEIRLFNLPCLRPVCQIYEYPFIMTTGSRQTGYKWYSPYSMIPCFSPCVLHFPSSYFNVPLSTVIKLRHGESSLGSCQIQPFLSLLDNFILNQE